jgi:two-component system NtrC family sensor kinase
MKKFIRSVVMQRAWWLVPMVFYVVTVGVSLRASISDIRQHNFEVATEGARNVFRTLVLVRQWNSSHGGVYVPTDERTLPNTLLDHPQRDVRINDGRLLTLVNPAYMTRMISELSRQEGGLVFRITSLNPLRPENAPDDWERQALTQIVGGLREVVGVDNSAAGDAVFRFMAPLRMSKDCLSCHVTQGYREGDIYGGISVSQSYKPLLEAALPSERLSIITHGLVFLWLISLTWWALERLRSSWRDLEDKIEELGQAHHELLQSEKMASLGRMVAGFAHEINTPVGIAVGAVSNSDEIVRRIDRLLAQDEVSEAELRDCLGELRHGGELALSNLRRAASLVQRFKRSSIDQASEQRRLFDVRETIDDLLASLRNQLKSGTVRVEVECAAGVVVDGIPGLLEQLLTNLVLNSLQHGFEEGARAGTIGIVVSTPAPGRLRLAYADDGVGMPSAVAERIFEPFFTTRRGQGGSGLGMYLCYSIVTDQLGGTIACKSAPGAGVRFEIEFPAAIQATKNKDEEKPA